MDGRLRAFWRRPSDDGSDDRVTESPTAAGATDALHSGGGAGPRTDLWAVPNVETTDRVEASTGGDSATSRWEALGFAPWVEPAYRRIRPVLSLLGIYAVVRTGLLVADALSAHLSYGTHPDGPLTSWDGSWYLTVATNWYPSRPPMAGGHLTYGPAAFEPVFPALIRFGEFFHLTGVQAGLTVSFIAGAVSVVLVWWLSTLVYGPKVARIATILFMVFPGMGICWGVLYSECVGLALVAGCLLLIVKRRFMWAGIVGALATATNATALPLALAALVPSVQAIRRHELPRAIITVVLVPMGFLGYAGWLGLHYHDTLYWWHLQSQAWGGTVDFGKSLLVLLVHPWSGGYQGKGWMEWAGLVAVAGAIFALVRARLPLVLSVYCGGLFLLLFVSNSLGFKPRFLAWGFPALIAVAFITRRRGWQPIALAFAFLLPLVFLAYASFGNY